MRRWEREKKEATYAAAAKKARSQVLGSLTVSRNLGGDERRGGLEGRHGLFDFERLVFDAGLIHLDASDGGDALLRRQEPRIRRRIWEEEPDRD